jgi:hypothetical protein
MSIHQESDSIEDLVVSLYDALSKAGFRSIITKRKNGHANKERNEV